MLSQDDQALVRRTVIDFWEHEVSSPEFTSIAGGKEIGHRIADYVDENTVRVLKEKFVCAHEVNLKGKVKPRSMGDVWIQSANIFNPVNVKSGQKGSDGQPNLVALQRLLEYILKRHIDSYYLLFVKFEIRGASISPHVHLVDLLECLEHTHFNSGPGQLMLKEKHFYETVEQVGDEQFCSGTMTILEKAEKLYGILEDANERLFRDRIKRQ